MFRLVFILPVILILFSVQPAWAGSMIKKESPFDVGTTLDRFETVIKKKGNTVFARIDHAEGARSAALELNDTQVVIFGNPKLGTKLMQVNRQVAFDLPLKALSWKDDEGKVWLGITNPADLNQTYALAGAGGVIEKMTAVLDEIFRETLEE